MIKRLTWITFSIMMTSIGYAPQIVAHGSNITYQKTEVMQLTAKYDNGEPMINAQVVVYAPNNPAEVWGKGLTDEKGQFLFNPDTEIKGNWTVKVRVSGHGQIINIPIESSLAESKESQPNTNSVMSQTNFTKSQINETNPLQKLVMAATGIWGFVGTALFFSRKNG